MYVKFILKSSLTYPKLYPKHTFFAITAITFTIVNYCELAVKYTIIIKAVKSINCD